MPDDADTDAAPDAASDSAPEEETAAARPGFWAIARRALAAFADWFWANAVVGLFGVWLAGQMWRDGSRWTARLFLVPSVCVAAALLGTALLARLCTCRRIAWAALILSVPPLASALLVENRWWRPATTGDAERQMRLVHWNLGPSPDGIAAKIERLKSLEADAYLLTEVYAADAAAQLAQAMGPEFTYVHQHHMLLLARGRTFLILTKERIRRRAYFVEWGSPHGMLTVLLVDAPSTYYHARLLRDVRDRIVTHEVDVAAGDFNASRRSRALRLPKGYAHAYDAAGRGWSATWHDRWPLWDIDQCIVGPRIQPIRYRLQTTGLSDHRLGILDFSVAVPPAEGSAATAPMTAAAPGPQSALDPAAPAR